MGSTLLSLIVRLVEFIILITGLLKTFIMLKLGEILTEQLNMLIQLFVCHFVNIFLFAFHFSPRLWFVLLLHYSIVWQTLQPAKLIIIYL